ncbi:hypothetical protein HGRIS_014804 [Hohenbuehelia grisea]|uniref:Uncharacterized protein n=1 Tax=Hohenbuehelia grisea TaxID=104357 RepID=A0ABR3IQS5_9AGAR
MKFTLFCAATVLCMVQLAVAVPTQLSPLSSLTVNTEMRYLPQCNRCPWKRPARGEFNPDKGPGLGDDKSGGHDIDDDNNKGADKDDDGGRGGHQGHRGGGYRDGDDDDRDDEKTKRPYAYSR